MYDSYTAAVVHEGVAELFREADRSVWCGPPARPGASAAPSATTPSPLRARGSEMSVLLFVLILTALAVAANRFGVDSRDGADWSLPGQGPAARR